MTGATETKELLMSNLTRPVLLYGDPDVDGLVSLLLMTRVCDLLGVGYEWYVNKGRRHGFYLDPADYRGYLIISADFGMNQATMERICNNDIVLIASDHHEIEGGFLYSPGRYVMVNNQYAFEDTDNRYNSGAGVCFELYSQIFPELDCEENRALVGLTLLSDVRPIEGSAKAEGYLNTLYNADTRLINWYLAVTMTGNYGFGKPKLDRNYADYTFCPIVNAMLRFDKVREAAEFILGQRPPVLKCHPAQMELVGYMLPRLRVMKLPDVHILATSVEESGVDCISNFIGLMAGKYKDVNNDISVLIFCTRNGEVERASFRGKYGELGYRDAFRENGYAAQGHASAFGFEVFPVGDWRKINEIVHDIEQGYDGGGVVVLETSNLGMFGKQRGIDIAVHNCMVRDMYRTYVKYKGANVSLARAVYKSEEVTEGESFDFEKGGKRYKFLLDPNGRKIPKFMEYVIDGVRVKSFGAYIDNGVILPMLDRGYVVYYLKTV